MPRKAREKSMSGSYRITLRGEALFMTDADKRVFTELLEKNFEGGKIYGFEIAKTEIRLVVKESERGVSMCMKSLVTSYARYINRTYNREGKLFLDRFKSAPLESDADISQALADIKSMRAETAEAKSIGDTKSKARRVTPAKKDEGTVKSVPGEPGKKSGAAEKNLPSWLL